MLLTLPAIGQDIDLKMDRDLYHQIDRMRLKTGGHVKWHSSLRDYDHDFIHGLTEQMDSLEVSRSEREWISYLSNLTRKDAGVGDSIATGNIWDHLYRNPAYFYSNYGKDFHVHLNPLVHFSAGNSSEKDGLLGTNARGLAFSGSINDIFFFYTDIIETQRRFPAFIDRYIDQREAIPQNGFYKPYKSEVFDFEDGRDYLNSTGYLSIRVTDNVGFQFGHGRHFIGNGYRSVLLGDFSNNYFYLQADWKFWKIHYRNIWSELRPRSAIFGGEDDVLPRKYSATHHLSLNFTPTFNIGLFETVVYHRSDQLELGYFNPVILYRTVEQSANSPDNVLLGFDLRWDVWQTISFYGQLVFDEFRFRELVTDNQGWWGNKYALQVGAQYIDVLGLPDLDIRLEHNRVRPYTYTHRDSSASYSHFNLPLAHPLGANFHETVLEIRYQPFRNFSTVATVVSYVKGEDGADENWGGDILLPHGSREREFDNKIGQGIENRVLFMDLSLTYKIFDGLYLDSYLAHRTSERYDRSETIYQMGIRYNMAKRNYRL